MLFVIAHDLVQVTTVVETIEQLGVQLVPLFGKLVTCLSGPVGELVLLEVVFDYLENCCCFFFLI